METVGERLKRLRMEQGLSQRALAEPGITYAYISRIESGTRQPSIKALRKLAAKLGVTSDYLETGYNLTGELVEVYEYLFQYIDHDEALGDDPDKYAEMIHRCEKLDKKLAQHERKNTGIIHRRDSEEEIVSLTT